MHGDYLMPNGGSSTSDALALGSHMGTHIDALCHFSCGGKLYGGHDVASAQSYGEGMKQLSIDTLAPIVRRGILLDIAGQQQAASLPAAFEITPEHMELPLVRKGSRSGLVTSFYCELAGRVLCGYRRV